MGLADNILVIHVLRVYLMLSKVDKRLGSWSKAPTLFDKLYSIYLVTLNYVL